MNGRVLLVDDDRDLTSTLALGLTQRGLEVRIANDATAAFALLDSESLDAVLTDVHMPGLDGIAFCARVGESHPDLPVVVLTGFGTLETAVAAIRAGAWDFLSKPAKLDAIAIALDRALQAVHLKREVRRLREEVTDRKPIAGLVARSEAMQGVLDVISRVGASPTTVLVTGESGTGKELVARALHERSGRRGPFVAVNCAAMPEQLLESELFGHARGAFTDAHESRPGLFTEANGGTLLLDEIGDMPLGLQPKLLRVLQERRVRPIGARSDHAVDVRVIAATHRDLDELVERGTFREDLYFRINVLNLALPPLRERAADLLPLAQSFVEEFARRSDKPIRGITPAAADRLLRYDWPGNVRELQNCMERAVALTRYEELGVEDLPERVARSSPVVAQPVDVGSASDFVTLEEAEKRYVLRVLAALDGNKTRAARTLGIERKTLYRKLESWGLSNAAEPEPTA